LSAGTSMDFTFRSTVEATYSLPDFIHPKNYDVIASYESGTKLQFPTLGARLGSTVTARNYNQNPVQVVYELLYWAGFYANEENYDTASFIATANAETTPCAVSTPINSRSQVETFRVPLSKVAETFLLKVYTKNAKWHVSQIGPMGATTRYVTKNDVIGGVNYRVSSEELATLYTAKYSYGELTVSNESTNESWLQESSTATVDSIGSLEKNRSKNTAIAGQAYVEDWANRYLYMFSKPLGFLTVTLGLPFIDVTMDDIIEIDPTDFDNLPFSTPKKFSVIGFTENMDSITLELWDQRGIEENSGDW